MDILQVPKSLPLKPLIGFSDITTLQIYLWHAHRWTGFYGPMLAAGLDHGPGVPGGYDEASFRNALTKTSGSWTIPLQGEILQPGSAEGIVLGGAMTLLEATLGTPWELDTDGAILILEDRAMKPYQIDRVLMHLKHARKLSKIRGLILGDFPQLFTARPSATPRAPYLRCRSAYALVCMRKAAARSKSSNRRSSNESGPTE